MLIHSGKEHTLAGGYNVDKEVERITEERKQQLESVKENVLVAQHRQKDQYDHKHSNPEIFAVGALDFTHKKCAGRRLDSRLGDVA